jgi:hypothetical protein
MICPDGNTGGDGEQGGRKDGLLDIVFTSSFIVSLLSLWRRLLFVVSSSSSDIALFCIEFPLIVIMSESSNSLFTFFVRRSDMLIDVQQFNQPAKTHTVLSLEVKRERQRETADKVVVVGLLANENKEYDLPEMRPSLIY